MGQDVQVVHDGAAAVDAVVHFDPSIVFIDLSMPGIDGYETARRIRALPGSETRRLVAVTGFGRATVETRISEAGFDHYLAKPARPEELERLFA
jgi:CheY-like chemotaxis protein